MEKESLNIQDYLKESTRKDNKQHVLATFFEKRNYIPKNEQEKSLLENFSFIAAAMSLLIHICKSKGDISEIEKEAIIDRLVFQLHQRSFEYSHFEAEYGKAELVIINRLYDKLLDEYENNQMHIDEQVRLINFVYQNNLMKRFFIIRLCFYIALADKELNIAEKKEIEDLAEKLNIEDIEIKRIKAEVIEELEIN